MSTIRSALCALIVGSVCVADEVKPAKTIVKASDGLNLVCDVRGQGDTALIILHGWCGTRDWWKHQVGEFAKDFRVVTLDQAGHGESGKDRKEWTIAGLGQDVESVVKQLGLKRVILIGHSMGGPVSLAAAKRMPGTVVAVVGVDTLQNVEFKWPEEVTKHFLDGFESDFNGSMRNALQGMFPPSADPKLVESITAGAQKQDPKMAVALMKHMTRLESKGLLKEAGVPIRCINAGPGAPFATPTAEDVNKKYADFKAVIVDGVGHFPMLEKPAEFNSKLRDVLKEFAK
jgi:pimeloyl-ACP methyl ester carboxylesterase